MKMNDKVLAAFLVSLGLFSTTQAAQYINSLSANDKQALSSAAQTGTDEANGTDPRQVLQQENN